MELKLAPLPKLSPESLQTIHKEDRADVICNTSSFCTHVHYIINRKNILLAISQLPKEKREHANKTLLPEISQIGKEINRVRLIQTLPFCPTCPKSLIPLFNTKEDAEAIKIAITTISEDKRASIIDKAVPFLKEIPTPQKRALFLKAMDLFPKNDYSQENLQLLLKLLEKIYPSDRFFFMLRKNSNHGKNGHLKRCKLHSG